LAVAAQIPCQYCVYFHTKAAKAQGANDMEVREAVASSAVTRHWSALLAGNQIEEAVFKRDTDSALNFMKGRMDRGEQVSNDPIDLVDAAAAYRDIQSSFGSVPNFFKVLPEESLIGAWRDLREFQFNPKTALSLKVKLLIGLAVSAQTPWASGNYFSTRSSMMLAGASEREIRECIAMSAQTRHWSTILNGNQINERQFRSEVDRILNRNRHDVSMVKPSRKLLVAHR
jgi:AhpD family alkylhydroperoxidase